MILSDKTIAEMLANGELSISPLEENQIQPASVDIRLGNTFSVVEDSSGGIIDLEKEIKYKTITASSRSVCSGYHYGIFLPARQPDRLCGRSQLSGKNGAFYPECRLGRPRL